MGNPRRAIQDFDISINLNPDDALAYANRGLAYYSLGDSERAIQDYDETIRLAPMNVLTYANRSLAYMTLGLDPEALADAERAIELGVEPTRLQMKIQELLSERS